MKLIILIAGRGRRLSPFTDEVPKSLVKVDGHEILDWQLNTAKYFKFSEIILVGGYKLNILKNFVNSQYDKLNIKIINNPDYLTSDNIVSLRLALEEVGNEEVIIMNGDLIFHREIFKNIISSSYINSIATIRKECNEEDMKVKVKDGIAIELSKQVEEISGEDMDYIGQALGIYKIGNVRMLKSLIKSINKKQHFNEAINQMILKMPVNIEDITNYPAIEIDTPEDLTEAQDIFKWDNPEWEFGIRHGSPLNNENALKLLTDCQNVMNKYGVPIFFIFGTALGTFRDKKLIPWDTDLDVGVYFEDREKIIKAEKELKKLGCYIPDYCNYYYDRWYIRDKEKIELHLFEKISDMRVYDIYRCNFRYPAYMIDNLVNIDLYGRTFKIPSDTQKFIELSYGKDWRTPRHGQKTTQIPEVKNIIRKKVLICREFNPVSRKDLEFFDKISDLGELTVLVHSDKYLVYNNRYPIVRNETERRLLVRMLKGIPDTAIATDENGDICKDLEFFKPHIYLPEFLPVDRYEEETCKNLGIKIITKWSVQQ